MRDGTFALEEASSVQVKGPVQGKARLQSDVVDGGGSASISLQGPVIASFEALEVADSASVSFLGPPSSGSAEQLQSLAVGTFLARGSSTMAVEGRVRWEAQVFSLQDRSVCTLKGALAGEPLSLNTSAASVEDWASVLVSGRVQWQTGRLQLAPLAVVDGDGRGHAQNTAPQGCQAATAKSYGYYQAGEGGSHAGIDLSGGAVFILLHLFNFVVYLVSIACFFARLFGFLCVVSVAVFISQSEPWLLCTRKLSYILCSVPLRRILSLSLPFSFFLSLSFSRFLSLSLLYDFPLLLSFIFFVFRPRGR